MKKALPCGIELGDQGGLAYSKTLLGLVALYDGDVERGRALLEESVRLFRDWGEDMWGLALSLRNLAEGANYVGDKSARRALLEESVRLYREVGNPWGIGPRAQ